VGKVIGWKIGNRVGRERKDGFVERDMAGNDDSIRVEIKAAVSFVLSGVADENTRDGSRVKFVASLSFDVWVT
jgi:hypothetical protein